MAAMDDARALVVGISRYLHLNPLAPIVVKDARDIYNLLIDPHYCGYPEGNVTSLMDEEATQSAVREALADLAQRCDDRSTVFIYISSHGGRIESGAHASSYLLTVDTAYDSDQSLAQTAISGEEFTEALSAIPARKLVVVFDCCHSGDIGQPKDAAASLLKSGLSEQYYETLKAGRGRVVLASSRGTEYSWILPGAQNSLFTHHLLNGLRGGAPGPGGVIRIFDLFHYLQPKVTADEPGQHPVFKGELEENFPVALYHGGKWAEPGPEMPTPDNFAYDVFISYSQHGPETTWVRTTLEPRLKAAGLRVIDYEGFRLGAPLIKEMERAVEKSRYTLIILSPSYLNSTFADLENVLAEHLGLELSQRRLLAVMRERCKPRLSVRARLWLDMTQDDQFDIDLARLVYELRQPPEA